MNTISRYNAQCTTFLSSHGKSTLRIALGIVFFWFGLLKIIGNSPVVDLIATTYSFLPIEPFLIFLGMWEVVIGLGLLFGKYLRIVLPLMWIQMLGTFFAVFLAPGIFFLNGNPILLTTEGEFVIKNLVLVAASFWLIERPDSTESTS